MKKSLLIMTVAGLVFTSCSKHESTTDATPKATTETVNGGQEAVVDEDSAQTL